MRFVLPIQYLPIIVVALIVVCIIAFIIYKSIENKRKEEELRLKEAEALREYSLWHRPDGTPLQPGLDGGSGSGTAVSSRTMRKVPLRKDY